MPVTTRLSAGFLGYDGEVSARTQRRRCSHQSGFGGAQVTIGIERRVRLQRTTLGTPLAPYPGPDRRERPAPVDLPQPEVTAPLSAPAPAALPAARWLARYRRWLLGVDLAILAVAALSG